MGPVVRPGVPFLVVLCLLMAAAVPVSTGYHETPFGEEDTSYHPHDYLVGEPVHFPAGHIQPQGGLAVIAARDLWWYELYPMLNPQVGIPLHIGGLICQVPAGSVPCGPNSPAVDPTVRVFCGGITLRDGDNWHSGMDTYVWVGDYDKLGIGMDAGVWCENHRVATTGHVSHWPGH